VTDLYFCPTAREIEIAPGGGFTACCDQPKLHIPVQNGPTIPATVQILDAAKRADFQATQRLAGLEADGGRLARIIDDLSEKNSRLRQRAEKAEAERDQYAAGIPLICCDERHAAKVRGLEGLLAASQKTIKHWEDAHTREVAAHGHTERALAVLTRTTPDNPGPVRITPHTRATLDALAQGELYAAQIAAATALPNGTLHPILARLEAAGLVTSRWEEQAAREGRGTPRRRYYKLANNAAINPEEPK
jgi:hypothetical protein